MGSLADLRYRTVHPVDINRLLSHLSSVSTVNLIGCDLYAVTV